MVKMFQYFESLSYAILLNSFYFSIFVFIEMLFCLICTWVCRKMCRIEDITNFHGSLALSSKEKARYFKSPYYPILLNSFYLSIFAFINRAAFAVAFLQYEELKTLRIFTVPWLLTCLKCFNILKVLAMRFC